MQEQTEPKARVRASVIKGSLYPFIEVATKKGDRPRSHP